MAKRRKRRTRRKKYPIRITFSQGIVFLLTAFCLVIGLRLGLNGQAAGGGFTWEDIYDVLGVSARPQGLENLPSDAQAVHFIDVGQADATLLQSGQEYCLVDAGEASSEEALLSYLDAQGITRLKLLVMSHPHADHIGSMQAVLEHVQVEQVLLPDFDKAPYPTTRTFEKVMDTIEEQNIPVVTAEPGQEFSIGEATLSVLASGVETDNYNNLSQVLFYSAPGLRVMLTGDGETEVEEDALAHCELPRADVFKAAHHGSSTSNTLSFLQAIRPRYVVVSCGKDNSYGHPHKQALQNFAMVGAQVLRTDENGSVVIAAAEDGLQCYTASGSQQADSAA